MAKPMRSLTLLTGLALGDDACVGAGGDAIELHERGIADEVGNAAGDLHG
jgi:hypothetical protein